MSNTDWKISKTRRKMSDRRAVWQMKVLASRLAMMAVALTVAVLGLG